MLPIEELIKQEQHRTECFRYLATAFYQPDKTAFCEAGYFNNLKASLSIACPNALMYADQMEDSFNSHSEEELLVDYASLFVGPFHLKAPPYGSIYLDAEKRLMGETTMAVQSFYGESGLVVSENFKELPDHITAELEFLYLLTWMETESLLKEKIDEAIDYLKRQILFLEKYLIPWIGEFCKNIKENAETQYYKELADCLTTVINGSLPLCRGLKEDLALLNMGRPAYQRVMDRF